MNLNKILTEQLLKEALELYHGSIHSFDGFDLTKVGSGDGNDVHGYGIYFTDSLDVAHHYANIYQTRADKYVYTVKVLSNNFLEWDGYIDEWEAQKILKTFNKMNHDESALSDMMDMLGLSEDYYGNHPWVQSMYDYLAVTLGSKKAASEFLDKCGFDGIKFDSKEAGTNANNYVIFDVNNIRILDQEKV